MASIQWKEGVNNELDSSLVEGISDFIDQEI